MKRRIQYFGSIAAVKKQSLFLGITAIILGAAVIGSMAMPVSALDYQKTINVGFDIQDTLTVSLSSPNLVISDLTPGIAADSNIVTINVLSNNPYGYTLTSTVGDTTYTNRNLTHSTITTGTIPTFTSLDYGSSVADMSASTVDPNTWGYSYSDQTVTTPTWTAYSGLPLYSDTTNIATLKESSTTSAAAGDNIQFKIAAKAADTQLAGEYKNVVNFAVVGGSAPAYYMQDVGTWGSTLAEGSEITAIDNRDNKEYTVAKLADGNIWMTQNLDFDIDSNKTYTSADTDISASWTPSTSTYATGTTTWNGSYTAPESYDPGNVCWDGTMNDDWDGTLDNETTSCTAPNHYHIGNYYNWTAAVAMNDSSSYTTDQQDVNQSICPAGWRLPTYSGNKSYDNLVTTLDLTAGSEASAGADGNIQNSPVFFPYAGRWYGDSGNVGGDSTYWSSVVGGSNDAYGLGFDVGGGLAPQGGGSRDYGFSVRCVAR